MKTEVTSKPDFRAMIHAWKTEQERQMQTLGELLTLDYQLRIQRGVDIYGNAQKPNPPGYQQAKQRKYGTTLPLVATRLLSVTGAWRVEVRGLQLWISPPAQRGEPILGRLLAKGYRVPGFSGPAVAPVLEPYVKELFGVAFARAAGMQDNPTIEAAFRRVLGS